MVDGTRGKATWALVPVKPLNRAKNRLASVLSAEQRARLQRAMLSDVLSALTGAGRIDRVAVTSSDPAVAEIAESHGVRAIPDESGGNLNAAIEAAAATLRAEAAWILVIPADVPLLDPAEIDMAVERAERVQATVVVPDRHLTGTNALVFQAAEPPTFVFGPDSFRRHLACTGCRPPMPLTLASLALDVDTPEDLACLQGATAPRGARQTRLALSALGQNHAALQENRR